MATKYGFSDADFKNARKMLKKLPLDRKDVNRAASKALIPAAKEVKQGIRRFRGQDSGVSISGLLSRMVRRKMNRSNYLPGARITISGPDIPIGDRDWTAIGVAKLFQTADTGKRTTRTSGANRGRFRGEKVGGGDNYISRFAQQVETQTMKLFVKAGRKLMRDRIKKAKNA